MYSYLVIQSSSADFSVYSFIAIIPVMLITEFHALVSPSEKHCPEPRLESGYVEAVILELNKKSVAYYVCNKTSSQVKKVCVRYCQAN